MTQGVSEPARGEERTWGHGVGARAVSSPAATTLVGVLVGALVDRQITQPVFATELSACHEMVDPAVTPRSIGPWVPSNDWLPICNLSNPLSVLNTVELTEPDMSTAIEHV